LKSIKLRSKKVSLVSNWL